MFLANFDPQDVKITRGLVKTVDSVTVLSLHPPSTLVCSCPLPDERWPDCMWGCPTTTRPMLSWKVCKYMAMTNLVENWSLEVLVLSMLRQFPSWLKLGYRRAPIRASSDRSTTTSPFMEGVTGNLIYLAICKAQHQLTL